MYHLFLNVFVILLSWPPPVTSQTPLESAISQLNPCASSCIAKFAAAVKCRATDYVCQCSAHPSAIIGPNEGFSPQGGCLVHDCGFSNITGVRKSFKTICDLEAASRAIANKFSTSRSTPSSPSPTISATTANNAPTFSLTPTTTTVIPTLSSFIPAFPPPAESASITISSASQAAAPQTTNAALQAPISSSTDIQPTDSSTVLSTTPLADNTPVEISQSASPPTIFAGPLSALSSISPSTSLSVEPTAIPAPQISSPAPQTSPVTDTNPALQNANSTSSVSQKRLSPGLVAGIIFLALGFIFTLFSYAFIHFHRQARKRSSSYITEEKLRPATPSPRDGTFSSSLGSISRWLPWDRRGKNTQSSPETQDFSFQQQPNTGTSSRKQSRGRQNNTLESENGNHPPSSFPMSSIQGVSGNASSPPSTARPGTSGSGSSAGQPLKSALKKPRDRPKSRPLILRDGDGGFSFGLDPLGSHPRSPR